VRDLPQALPPGERTVGQLVAESIRAYGNRFWATLPLGIPLAFVDQLSVRQPAVIQIVIYLAAAPLFVAAYLRACRLVLDARPTRTAVVVATLIYVPFPMLRAVFILPGLAWFAFIGLAVPAAMVDRLGFRDALERGRRLGHADYVHALGSLAALVIVVGLAASTLSTLLHTQGDNGQRVAVFLSDLVLSPLLYVGAALLYVDQVARMGARRTEPRSRDADLHPPLDVDAAGGPDAQVEP
jgi:hypothetical protein